MSTYIINKNHVIIMNRGDSVNLPISIMVGKFPESRHKLEIKEGDIIFFGLMFPRQHFECAIIKKEFDKSAFDSEGNFVLTLEPLDTMRLESGTYYYELKLLKASDDSITTLIPKSRFNIVD